MWSSPSLGSVGLVCVTNTWGTSEGIPEISLQKTDYSISSLPFFVFLSLPLLMSQSLALKKASAFFWGTQKVLSRGSWWEKLRILGNSLEELMALWVCYLRGKCYLSKTLGEYSSGQKSQCNPRRSSETTIQPLDPWCSETVKKCCCFDLLCLGHYCTCILYLKKLLILT